MREKVLIGLILVVGCICPSLQFGGPYPSFEQPSYGGGSYSGGQQGNACEMTQQCCGFQQKGCCINDQKCYVVNERVCMTTDTPNCAIKNKEQCFEVTIPSCKAQPEERSKTVEEEFCLPPVKEQQCVEVWDEICDDNEKLNRVTDVVEDQEYVFQSYKWENVTFDVDEVSCKPNPLSDTRTTAAPSSTRIPKRRTRIVMKPKFIPGEFTTVRVPSTVYSPYCYNVKVPVCPQVPCQQRSLCGTGEQPCSLQQTTLNRVCPSDAPCYGEQQPRCFGQFPQSCRPNSQACCKFQYKQICKNVPKTVWNTVRKQLPGRWVSVRERVPVTYDVVKTRYEFLIPHAGGGVLDCHVVPGQKPGRVRVPVYSTRPKGRRSISVNVDVTTCNKKRVKRQQCVEVERARCGKRHVPANYTVNPVVCNGQEVKSCCVNVPSLDCDIRERQKCFLLSKKVCVKTCSTDPACNTCSQFIQGGGFGSCPTSSCGNYIPPYSAAAAAATPQYPGGFPGSGYIPPQHNPGLLTCKIAGLPSGGGGGGGGHGGGWMPAPQPVRTNQWGGDVWFG